jgi:hypothetical protein
MVYRAMNNHLPHETSPNSGLDIDLVLTFLADCHALEGALVRAGFTRAGSTPGNARPDWSKFARHIEGKFDPESSPELIGAVCYLLGELESPERRWEQSGPQSDIFWLSELVRKIRNRLLLRINFAGGPCSDITSVLAAMLIVEAWSTIDPKVESLLTHVQQPEIRDGRERP